MIRILYKIIVTGEGPVSYNLLSITSYNNCYKLLKSWHLIGLKQICIIISSFVSDNKCETGPRFVEL